MQSGAKPRLILKVIGLLALLLVLRPMVARLTALAPVGESGKLADASTAGVVLHPGFRSAVIPAVSASISLPRTWHGVALPAPGGSRLPPCQPARLRMLEDRTMCR